MDSGWLIENRNRLIEWQKGRSERPLEDGVIRLHIGSGHLHWPGYVNVDPYTSEADEHYDGSKLPQMDESVDEVCCHHALEHIPQRKLESTLDEWVRVLKPGGILDIGMPDIELCFEYFNDAQSKEKWEWWIHTIYGYQVDSKAIEPKVAELDEGQFHRAGVTKAYLRQLLVERGLEIVECFNYDAYDTPSVWILARKPINSTKTLTALEQDVALGVFTNKTDYLPALMNSAKKYLPGIPFLVKLQDAPINANMEALRREFIQSGKRYWVFLDDDIQFLNSSILHDTVKDMIKYSWACGHVYSEFDPACLTRPYSDTLKLIESPAVREIGWATGYFIMVDSWKVGNIQPDLNLPYPNTSVDTSYSAAIRKAGYKIGISKNAVYHLKKSTPVDEKAVEVTNQYLMAKWGQFYYDHCVYAGNVIEWPASKYRSK
jgi:SAM-dependent methyltransferase